MFFFLSKVLDVLLTPYSWGLALCAAAVPWRGRAANGWKRRRAFGAAGLLLLLVASSTPFADGVQWSLEHSVTPTYEDAVTYDAVVLLGGVVDEEVTTVSGQPSYNDNVERLIMTHRLLRDGKARVAIVSGGTTNPKFAANGEAAALARQLTDWGIADERIVLESRALNTRENAVYTQEIARARGYERVLVVTSAFHMRRALECFNAVGMKVDVLPVDFRARRSPHDLGQWLPRANALATTSAIFRETFGRFVYRARGYGKRDL